MKTNRDFYQNMTDKLELPDAEFLSSKYNISIEDDGSPKKERSPSKEQMLNEVAKNQEFAQRTERLIAALDQKNKELEKYAVLVESTSIVPGMDLEKYQALIASDEDAPDPRDHKIISLAKKVRNLSDNLRREKNAKSNSDRKNIELERKCNLLETQIDDINTMNNKNKLSKNNNTNSNNNNNNNNNDDNSMKENSKSLKREINILQKQNEDFRSNQYTLQEEIKKMKRLISKEVGDGDIMNEALNIDSGWRGRAQHIVMLKSKVRKLENELLQYKNGDNIINNNDITTNNNKSSRMNKILSNPTVDMKAESSIANMTAERTRAVESVMMENSKMEGIINNLEKKGVAQQARVKVLEKEVTEQRNSLSTMVDKADSDHQLIQALRDEIKRLQITNRKKEGIIQETKKSVNSRTINAQGKDVKDNTDINALKRLITQQNEQLDMQEGMIKELRSSKNSY